MEGIVFCNDCAGARRLVPCVCATAPRRWQSSRSPPPPALARGSPGRSGGSAQRGAKLRIERHQEQKPANPVALLRQRAEDLNNSSAALKQLADAEEPLLNSLSDAQKRLLSPYAGDRRARKKN